MLLHVIVLIGRAVIIWANFNGLWSLFKLYFIQWVIGNQLLLRASSLSMISQHRAVSRASHTCWHHWLSSALLLWRAICCHRCHGQIVWPIHHWNSWCRISCLIECQLLRAQLLVEFLRLVSCTHWLRRLTAICIDDLSKLCLLLLYLFHDVLRSTLMVVGCWRLSHYNARLYLVVFTIHYLSALNTPSSWPLRMMIISLVTFRSKMMLLEHLLVNSSRLVLRCSCTATYHVIILFKHV